MRTQGQLLADTPHYNGWIWVPAQLLGKFSANLVLTRNALGDYSLNRTATGAETYNLPASLYDLKRISGVTSPTPVPFQEQFGTAAGTAGWPAGAPGFPPFTGNTQLTPATAGPAKGLEVIDVCAVYQVGVVDLTSASLSLNRVTYGNNLANVITNLPIAATALPLTAAGDATGPYFVKRAVTTPAFETVDQSDLEGELTLVMANTGTIKIYGLGFHVYFNLT